MVCISSSCGCGCGYSCCETNLALSCKNPYSVCPCPSTSVVYCLFVTNQMTCSVRLCLTLSDSTTTSIIIPGSDTSGVQVGPFTSGAGVALTITFMEASVYPVCGKLCPLYNNTLPQTFIGTGLEMSISSAGVISFPGGYTCV